MRTSHASLSDPFDSSPLSFPEHFLQLEAIKEHNLPLALDVAAVGAWKYSSRRTRRLTLTAAIVLSVGFHTFLLLGMNLKHKAPRIVEEPSMSLMLIKLPEIPEDPEERLADLESEAVEGVDVPRQADIPTSVVLDTMITQRFDPRTLQPNLNLNGTKLLTIPNNIRVGGTGGQGLKEIFNIADLDRQPTALFQPPPTIPGNLRQEGTRVELVVEFIIDSKGNVVDATVIRTNNEKFNDVAIASILKWRFKPGMKKGRYVAARIHQPMIISIAESGT